MPLFCFLRGLKLAPFVCNKVRSMKKMSKKPSRFAVLLAVLASSAGAVVAQAETSAGGFNQANVPQQAQNAGAAAQQTPAQQHPLVPALEMAKKTKQVMDATLRDYSATVVKQERINGTLGEPEYAFIKVRNQPFSVYMKFIGPKAVVGQEAMYVEGKNDNKMFAHAPPDTLRGKIGTVQILPTSAIAMQGQRYPITELGIANLTKRLIEVGEHDKQFGECDVKFFQGAKVNGRDCTMIQVTHPVPRRNFLFHIARIYLDNELNMPIRYEAYEWPEKEGGAPVLLESYTYMNLQINQGFTDADFDRSNPTYGFK
jgi:hypothetical protein